MKLIRAIALALAFAAHAADSPHDFPSPELPASKVLGMEVQSPLGQELGEIEDLVVELDTGIVRYAMLGVGGVAGLGERYVPVALEAMTVGMYEEVLVADLQREQLEAAPAYSHERWPGLGAGVVRVSRLLDDARLQDLLVDVRAGMIRRAVLPHAVVPFVDLMEPRKE